MQRNPRPSDSDLLVFEIGHQQFALRAQHVREVQQAVTITAAPQAKFGVQGAVNIRGHVVPVLDLRALLARPSKAIETTDHLIVVQSGDQRAAIVADHALSLTQVAESAVEPASELLRTSPAVSGVVTLAGKLVYLLDAPVLLAQADSAVPASVPHVGPTESLA